MAKPRCVMLLICEAHVSFCGGILVGMCPQSGRRGRGFTLSVQRGRTLGRMQCDGQFDMGNVLQKVSTMGAVDLAA